MTRLLSHATVVALAAMAPGIAAAQPFQPLVFAPGGASDARGVSADGAVVAGCSALCGTFGSQAVRWKTDGSSVGLGILPGFTASYGFATSADGSVVVGNNATLLTNEGFRWTAAGGMVGLGVLPGYSRSTASAVNADGSVVVGDSILDGITSQPVRWTTGGGMVGLGQLPGDNHSQARGVSADGSVVMGVSYLGPTCCNTRVFRWTAAGGMEAQPHLPGYSFSFSTGMSADGSTIAGGSVVQNGSRNEAALWTAAGVRGLGFLPTGTTSSALAVNADGSVAVGGGNVNAGFNSHAFRWTAALGMQPIQGILAAGGFDTGGLTLNGALSVSADGTVIVGEARDAGNNIHAWIARIPVNAFASFDLAGTNRALGSLVWGGIVTNSGASPATLTAGSDNSSTTFIGTIQDGTGTTALTKTGTGTLTLTGAHTYNGATTVDAGTLAVNGSLASAVTVNNGGTLGGTGTVGPVTVHGGGTLSPGNSIGALTVNGNLILGAGSIYRIEVSPTGADRTNVNGTAALAGIAQLVFGPAAYTSNAYTILSATGGRTGTFDAVTTVNLPAVLSASLSYTSGDVLLVTLKSDVANVPGLTRNQRAVGAAQDAAFNGGLTVIPGLVGLTGAQLPAALDQLSGEAHASAAAVLVDESLYPRSAVFGRLRQASYGGDTGMASLATGGPLAFAGGEPDSTMAYAKSPIVTKAPLRAPRASSDIVFWAQGFGAWGRFDGDGNATSVRRDLAGFITGLDTRIGANGRAGIAAGYTGSRNALDGRGSANVETAHVAAYGGWSFGALNLRAGGAYAFHTIDTDRTVAFPGFFDRASAHYQGGTGQVFGEAGYGFNVGNIAVEPFAGAAFVHLRTGGATERGGLAALNVAGTTFETGYSTLGIRAASIVPLAGNTVLVPRATVAWQHAFGNVTPTAVLAFQGGAPFTISGVPIARDSLLTEAGLDLAIGAHATLGVSYTGQLARNAQDHAAKGKCSWKF